MSDQLIPVVTSVIGHQTVQTVDGRALHAFLEVETRFNDWIDRRIEEYGFVESQDFVIDYSNLSNQTGRGGDRRGKDYHERPTQYRFSVGTLASSSFTLSGMSTLS
jgi:anti-repressor protein